MGIKWTAILKVEFEMEDGQPANLGNTVLNREANLLPGNIERGTGIGKTGVKRDSARVEITSVEHRKT